MSLSVPPNDSQASKLPTLNGEINIESILALDEQIRQHERAIINLKRTRNSLLNVSKLPPEVLGNVFRWNACLKGDFDGLEKGSHNFLFVCHHWHEVAVGTQELWSFWGSTLADWARLSCRSRTAPLDLVLGDSSGDTNFDVALSNVLQDRAARDTIRRVHLRARDSDLLRSIISQITPKEPRSTNVESFILQDESTSMTVDISDFLTRYTFPKLQRLEYYGCTISSWDLLESRSPVLTTLDIFFRDHGPTPTTSQLLSVLASYPTLQKVALSWSEDPDDGDRAPSGRASLRHLKDLELDAPLKGVFGLLDRLDHPRNLDKLDITLNPCPFEDISRTIGPYLRDYLRRCGELQNGLGLSLAPFGKNCILLRVGGVGEIDFFSPERPRMNVFMKINMCHIQPPPGDSLGVAIFDLIAHTPRDEVVYFQTRNDTVAMKDLHALLSNLRGLHSDHASLSCAFRALDLGEVGEIFPSLQFVFLDPVVADDADWSPLATFLDRRVASGNPLHTLVVSGRVPNVWKELERAVRVYKHI